MDSVIYPLPKEGIYRAPRVPPPDWVGTYTPPLEYVTADKITKPPNGNVTFINFKRNRP